MNNKVAVIGAGPAGLTAAFCLAKSGIQVDVFEADSQVGGLAKTIDLWGHRVDLGPHRFFSNDRRVNQLWLEVMGRDYSIVNRSTRILYNQRFFDYPLTASNVLRNFGWVESTRCLISAIANRNNITNGSYESWLVNRFGKRLYHTFFRPYSEKLWGLPCSKIDHEFAAQRIAKLNFIEALKSAFHNNKKNPHLTFCRQFAYPHNGTGTVYERMAQLLLKHGGRLHLNTPVQSIMLDANAVCGVELRSGGRNEYANVISSMPLNQLVRTLTSVPAAVMSAISKLHFRNTVLIYLRISSANLFPDQWVYIQTPELRLGRVSNFNNWGPELNRGKDDSVLCLEYWCDFEEECWNWPDQSWSELAVSELRKTGLIAGAQVLDQFVKRIARSYPVYHLGYKDDLRLVESYLRDISGLHVIGRYGAFKYNNQNHSMLMGLLAAERITTNANHDLWAINSERETYQESSRIGESGLIECSGRSTA